MEGLKYTKAIRAYCDYIDRHLLNVSTSWIRLAEACKDMRFVYDDYVFHSIDAEVRTHDLSKFSEAEFIQYQRTFYPAEGLAPGSLGLAWIHHQEENPHHWQRWTREKYTSPYEAEVHCVGMVIDWMAMGLEFDNTAEEYYESHKDEIHLPRWAASFIGEIFKRLRAAETPEKHEDEKTIYVREAEFYRNACKTAGWDPQAEPVKAWADRMAK